MPDSTTDDNDSTVHDYQITISGYDCSLPPEAVAALVEQQLKAPDTEISVTVPTDEQPPAGAATDSDGPTDWVADSTAGVGVGFTPEQALMEWSQNVPVEDQAVLLIEHRGECVVSQWATPRVDEVVSEREIELTACEVEHLTHTATEGGQLAESLLDRKAVAPEGAGE